MKELVHAIDTYVEMVDLEVTNNLYVVEDEQGQTLAADQPIESVPTQQADDVTQLPPTEPSV